MTINTIIIATAAARARSAREQGLTAERFTSGWELGRGDAEALHAAVGRSLSPDEWELARRAFEQEVRSGHTPTPAPQTGSRAIESDDEQKADARKLDDKLRLLSDAEIFRQWESTSFTYARLNYPGEEIYRQAVEAEALRRWLRWGVPPEPTPAPGIFGRLRDDGDVDVLDSDGCPATRLDVPGLYPVGSNLSVRYEHAEGIVISRADAQRIGLPDDNGRTDWPEPAPAPEPPVAEPNAPAPETKRGIFYDSWGNPWAPCSPDTEGAQAFGPTGTARPALGVPLWVDAETETDEQGWDWLVEEPREPAPAPEPPAETVNFQGEVIPLESAREQCPICDIAAALEPGCEVWSYTPSGGETRWLASWPNGRGAVFRGGNSDWGDWDAEIEVLTLDHGEEVDYGGDTIEIDDDDEEAEDVRSRSDTDIENLARLAMQTVGVGDEPPEPRGFEAWSAADRAAWDQAVERLMAADAEEDET